MPSTAQSFEIFPWNSNLETGIALIDEQHARLVELLNRLAQQHVQGASAEEIQGILGELADYADYHFHSEEAIWQASLGDDPWFNQHQHSHQYHRSHNNPCHQPVWRQASQTALRLRHLY